MIALAVANLQCAVREIDLHFFFSSFGASSFLFDYYSIILLVMGTQRYTRFITFGDYNGNSGVDRSNFPNLDTPSELHTRVRQGH